MTMQETIIEALKTVQAAHVRALATIRGLRSDKTALDAEVARLNAEIASLRATVAHLEAEAAKIVEPESVRTLLASLAQVVAEGQGAMGTGHAEDTHVLEPIHSGEVQTLSQHLSRAASGLLARNTAGRSLDVVRSAEPAEAPAETVRTDASAW